MTKKGRFAASIFVCLLIVIFTACGGGAGDNRLYYAIEGNGTIFGYVMSDIQESGGEGTFETIARDEAKTISRALGMDVNVHIDSESRIDPETGRFSSIELNIDQGTVQVKVSAVMSGDTILITQNMGGGTKEIAFPPEGILTDLHLYPRLVRDFNATGLEKKTYQMLDLMDREFHKVTYTAREPERLQLAGTSYDALVLDALNHEIGAKARIWIDKNTGTMLKNEIPGLQTTYLADRSVKNKLRRLDQDTRLLSPAGVMIQDFQNLTHLKVKAVMEPIGNWITPESLSLPGQTFTGTVENNRVEGIFEIRHPRYDGVNPPPFPAMYEDHPELEPFLQPEDLIESDDADLVEKAGDLTAGAADSWEAAKRLSRWVAEEIGYAIPGGGSARNTYELRNGECGAHSRLFAALSRAAGIPARVVWGCMYVPNNEGSFGQHAWNEIYMGEAGWVPIDTTAREIDYCDSGHIRLGILASMHISFNARGFEVLDFTAGSRSFSESADSAVPQEFQAYIGRYQGPERVFEVLVQNGSLAVDIPGRMIFELREPDEQGRRYFTLTSDVHILFEEGAGGVTGMTLVNTPSITRQGGDEEEFGDAPENLRALCGTYPIPGQGEIRVFTSEGGLAISLPPNQVYGLEGPDDEGMWKLDGKDDRFSFVLDDAGIARAIRIYELVHLDRIE